MSSVTAPSARAAAPSTGLVGPVGLARTLFGVNALLAWAGVVLEAWLTIANVYPATGGKPGEIDYHNEDGLLGTLGHTFDFATFFTNWSNILVAVVVTALLVDPLRDSRLWRVLRLSSLIMIAITAVVYAVLLGPTAVNVDLQVPSNVVRHQVVPAVTLLVWLAIGPRRWIRWTTVWWSLVVPLAYVVWVLVRGAVIDGYPYGFLNVHELGYGKALLDIGGVMVVALLVAVLLYGVDVLLARLTHRAALPEPAG